MKDNNNSVIAIIIAIILAIGLIISISVKDENSHGKKEWISPDGVHYWVYDSGYGCGIAPRFDNNGNLVIDKQ